MRPHRKTPQPLLPQRIIQKHLIHNQRQPMPNTDRLQPMPILGPSRMSRRIVRMHHHNRLRPRPDPLLQLPKVDPPPMVIKQRIRPQPHVLQIRQKIKQRITRLRHQHLVPRIAQQPEQIPIPFARTRRQHHRIRINLRPMVARSTPPPPHAPTASPEDPDHRSTRRHSPAAQESPRHHTQTHTP